jgi:hypothetical protein
MGSLSCHGSSFELLEAILAKKSMAKKWSADVRTQLTILYPRFFALLFFPSIRGIA